MSKSVNTPSGGPATISGIIYQMLWSLLEAFAVQIKDCDSDPTGVTASQAFLILEPRGGGGDVVVLDSDVEVVQQLKTRSDEGAWSMREIVLEVLPDLYRAVKLDRAQRFVFVTEGHMGDWKEVNDFFQHMNDQPVPENEQDVLRALNDARKMKFRGTLAPSDSTTSTLTEQELFKEIVTILRQKEPAHSESSDLTHRKLWKLLASLEFRWQQTATGLYAHLRQRLRAVVDNADLLDQTLDALVTKLARQASLGNAWIEAETFLQSNGLPSFPLTNWHRLVGRSITSLEERLPLFRYDPAEDIRASLPEETVEPWLRGTSPFLVLSGESGQGKTWCLAHLARTLAQKMPAVFLEATGNGKQDQEEAASLFWQGLANHDTELPMQRIARRVRETIPLQAGCWLAVFVDNVRTNQEAEELYTTFRTLPGIRLAFTAPPEIAERFAEKFEPDTTVVQVGDFTDTELRQYIAGNDAQTWHSIPLDIRAVIRRPLLADLYRQLNQNGEQALNTEYKLYARYYQQRLVNPLRDQFPTAFVGLKKAALAVWHGDAYPWSLEQFQSYGLFEDQLINFLLKIGWLRRDERQEYQVWHDRLLNWHVAESLAEAIESGPEDAAAFGQRCAADFHSVPTQNGTQHLGYVFMDVMWLLAQRGTSAADAINTILQQIEDDFRTVQIVYESLLPTIGSAIAPALFRRLEATMPGRMTEGHIVNALGMLDAGAVASGAMLLLQSQDATLRRNGMGILAKRPAAAALDVLWLRYIALLKNTVTKEDERNDLWERPSLWPALEACARLDPQWVERKIQVDPAAQGELAGALTSLLNLLPNGHTQWLSLKETLRLSVSGGGERHFANAAYHWRDSSEVEWLKAHISSSESGVSASCLRALIRIAPQEALEVLGRLSPEDLSGARAWTIHFLWACRPEETSERIRELMLEQPDNIWDFAAIFTDLPDGLNGDMLRLFLDNLFERMADETTESLRFELRYVGMISRLPLLHCLQQRTGTDWEERLTRLLVEGDPRPKGWRDVFQQDVVQVLYMMGGAGFTRLINHWLANGDLRARREGIDIAFKRPDAETIRLLEEIAMQENDGERNDGSDYDSRIAQLALARSEAWHSVIKTMVLWQGQSNREMVFARWGAEPLSDADMEPALLALADNPKHPGAIMAMGFGQRTDFTAHIITVLSEENPQEYTEIVNACLWALTLLPQTPTEAVEVLAQRLSLPQGRWLVIPLLTRADSEQAVYQLLNFLRRELDAPLSPPYSADIADNAVTAADFLLKNSATCAETAAICRKRIARDGEPDFIAQRLINMSLDKEDTQEANGKDNNHDIFSLISDERTHDFLMQSAFHGSSGLQFVGERTRTIRGLSAFSSVDAYVAALRVLKDPKSSDCDRAPQLLLDINPLRAVSDLVDHLTAERKTHLRRTCARAICTAGKADKVREDYLTSLIPEHREVACFILGFSEPNAETEVAIRSCLADEDVRVFEAACRALCRMNAARYTDEIVKAYLIETSMSQRWVLLDTALKIGDVFTVSWLQKMVQTAPPMVLEYIQDRVKKQRDEDKRDAESEDRRNRVQ